MVRDVKNFSPKLNTTTLTLPGPPRPGPGYDVPPKPPSRRPWVVVNVMHRAGQLCIELLVSSAALSKSKLSKPNVFPSHLSAKLDKLFRLLLCYVLVSLIYSKFISGSNILALYKYFVHKTAVTKNKH